MKRLYSIFSVLIFLFAVSCVREELAAVEGPSMEEPTVPVILSFQDPVVLQAGTRAGSGMEMGVKPAIRSIHVAIFGRDRYLKDYVSALPCDEYGNVSSDGFVSENATQAYFLVRLPISSSERVLHIIANGPSSLPFNAYENEIMQNLRVSDGDGAYWQRIVLPGGITVQTEMNEFGQPVYKQDNNGEYIPSETTKTALSNLNLVRNFASVTVRSTATNFELIAYTLCNMPSSGSIAMYSTNHADWVPGYTGMTLVDYLINYDGETYLGFPVAPDLDTHIPTTADAFDAPGVTVGPAEPVYVYERALTDDNPPFILMAARYVKTGTPTESTPVQYYRLDLALEDGYFPIYRNFQYAINISGVSVGGYADPGTASKHNSGSNFSVSLDTSTLPDVSNGVVRMYVEKPTYDWVYNTDQQKFWFKFILNSDNSPQNGSVVVTEKEGNAINSLSTDGQDTGSERYVRYRLNQPDGTSTLSSTLQLVGTYTSGEETYRLVRKVTIRVFNAKEVHPKLTPSTVADQADQLTTLGIPLPWDLQSSMFPMDILIEDSQKALNPMPYENMSVKTTPVDEASEDEVFTSLTGSGKPSFCFVRTLNWSDYQRLKNDAELSGSDDILLNCDFQTTKPFGDTEVFVYNKFFATDAQGVTTARVTLHGDLYNNITPNRQTISGTAASVTVKSSGNWTLSISLANGNVAAGASLSPASGTSTGTSGETVTVTLPENVTANAIRYLLTLTNTSEDPALKRTAYITQEGIRMSLSSATTSVGNGASAVSVNVQSGARYVLEVLDADGNLLYQSGEYEATTGENGVNRDVTIPMNTTLSERTLTIRARNLLSTIWEDITITQEAGTAALTVVDSEIRMATTSAVVNVASSFTTYLKAYLPGGSEPFFTKEVSANAAHDETVTGIPANNTGADRTIRVDLCDASGNVLRSGTLTQRGTPVLALTAAGSTSLGNTATSTTLNIDSELAWAVSVSGGISGATLTPASGAATTAGTITLALPDNNTTSAQTYTVTADNGTQYAYTGNTVTVTQAAGVASLSQVDSEIMMQESTAQVSVTTSFATTLRVFNNDTDQQVGSDMAVPSTGSAASVKTVTVGTNSGSAITYRVQLYNSDNQPVGNSITFVQKPLVRITAAQPSVKGNENATVTVVSDVNWTLTTTGGTLSTTSGGPTSGQSVTLTMDVNYSTSVDERFTVTVQGTDDPTLNDAVEITHRKATAKNNQTFNFAPSLYRNPDKLSVTSNGMTAEYQRVVYYDNSYLEITNRNNTSTWLRISIDNTVSSGTQVMKISKVYIDYTTGFGPGSTSSNPTGISDAERVGRITNSTWQGQGGFTTIGSGYIQLTFNRYLTSSVAGANTRIGEVTVTYDAIEW